METIPELRPIVEDGKPMFSGGANDFVQQVEQVRLRRCKLLKKLNILFQQCLRIKLYCCWDSRQAVYTV